MFNTVQELVNYVVNTLGVERSQVKAERSGTNPGVQIYGNKFIPLSCSEEEVKRRVEEFQRMLGR
ncbi:MULTISPECIES: hypothetical protein [Fusobacterium]|uniref:hypothetical protein n=1 Tax=Fusobacterium TaxID=848 RepID=UPI00102F59A0|nr:hypothetical protein [Fusobacterium ulcerans]